ncbi:MAG TPA: zf-HC2 domain-containing protein [Bacteroidales bacterium]|nr:zf-HC2 domain-containing protein [Bacteroidales bacterium]
MKCEEVESLMNEYLDNKLDTEQVTEIENHLEKCERCLDIMRDTQEIFRKFASREMESPDESLKINFYHMLHNEIRRSEMRNYKPLQTADELFRKRVFRYAAGIALLITFTLSVSIIYMTRSGARQNAELSKLRTEINELRKTSMLTMMKDASSTSRIQAVGFATEMTNPDEDIINVLIRTLNSDKNVNVRMASAYALTNFTDKPEVRESLVNSLSYQDDPIIQVTLINILAGLREKRAYQPVQKIINDQNTLKEVRTVAENSLRYLL